MQCHEFVEAAVARLAGALPASQEAELARHLSACEACGVEVRGLESAWSRLGDLPDPAPSVEFCESTLARLEEETLARRMSFWRGPRLGARGLLHEVYRVAALLAAVTFGFAFGRGGNVLPAWAHLSPVHVPLDPQRTIDAAHMVPDLSHKPRLANVSYRPTDPGGRIGVAFDVTTHYTILGKPEEKGISNLLAYLVSGAAETEGARGKAIDLVSRTTSPGSSPSPEIVAVLIETLRSDKNPGVRKKAAETLAQLPPTASIRDAFISAVKSDSNPAVRIVAVDGLARTATSLRDPATIETLREKAREEGENGYVRGRAASALKGLAL